jgi:hypothetical protein
MRQTKRQADSATVLSGCKKQEQEMAKNRRKPPTALMVTENMRAAKILNVASFIRYHFWDRYRVSTFALTGLRTLAGEAHDPMWDGDAAKKTTRASTNVWTRAAEFCVAREIDPEVLVSACFTPLRFPVCNGSP